MQDGHTHFRLPLAELEHARDTLANDGSWHHKRSLSELVRRLLRCYTRLADCGVPNAIDTLDELTQTEAWEHLKHSIGSDDESIRD